MQRPSALTLHSWVVQRPEVMRTMEMYVMQLCGSNCSLQLPLTTPTQLRLQRLHRTYRNGLPTPNEPASRSPPEPQLN